MIASFDRDAGLTIVPVANPCLELLAGEPAGVRALMERMMVVIASGPPAAQPIDELLFRQRGAQRIDRLVHSVISMPSSAICHPAVSAA